MMVVTRKLEVTLGPGNLELRFGLHSGAAVPCQSGGAGSGRQVSRSRSGGRQARYEAKGA
jgi:hypothetical protein